MNTSQVQDPLIAMTESYSAILSGDNNCIDTTIVRAQDEGDGEGGGGNNEILDGL